MFENDDSTQRAELIQALQAVGLDAWELNSGGGTMHVIVTLLDCTVEPPVIAANDARLSSDLHKATTQWPEAYLYIATNSLETDCEIGLMGADGKSGAQLITEEWTPVDSLRGAVSKFQQCWSKRDEWLRRALVGELATI